MQCRQQTWQCQHKVDLNIEAEYLVPGMSSRRFLCNSHPHAAAATVGVDSKRDSTERQRAMTSFENPCGSEWATIIAEARNQQFLYLAKLAQNQKLSTPPDECTWKLHMYTIYSEQANEIVGMFPALLDCMQPIHPWPVDMNTLSNKMTLGNLPRTGKLGIAASVAEAVELQLALYNIVQHADYHKGWVRTYTMFSSHRGASLALVLSVEYMPNGQQHERGATTASLFIAESEYKVNKSADETNRSIDGSYKKESPTIHLGIFTLHSFNPDRDKLTMAIQLRAKLLDAVDKTMEA